MITFNNYTVLLLLLSGLLVLVFDVKIYTKANLLREKKGLFSPDGLIYP